MHYCNSLVEKVCRKLCISSVCQIHTARVMYSYFETGTVEGSFHNSKSKFEKMTRDRPFWH